MRLGTSGVAIGLGGVSVELIAGGSVTEEETLLDGCNFSSEKRGDVVRGVGIDSDKSCDALKVGRASEVLGTIAALPAAGSSRVRVVAPRFIAGLEASSVAIDRATSSRPVGGGTSSSK